MNKRRYAAQLLLDLSYVELMSIGEDLVAQTASDMEVGQQFDKSSPGAWAEKLRWWAENFIDSER